MSCLLVGENMLRPSITGAILSKKIKIPFRRPGLLRCSRYLLSRNVAQSRAIDVLNSMWPTYGQARKVRRLLLGLRGCWRRSPSTRFLLSRTIPLLLCDCQLALKRFLGEFARRLGEQLLRIHGQLLRKIHRECLCSTPVHPESSLL